MFWRHRKQGGEGPPSSSSSLTFSLDWGRVSPLVLGSHGEGGARAPPRSYMSFCLSLFLRSLILPWHRFFYIWRSVTLIGLKPSPRYFYKNSFLAAKVEHQPPYKGPMRVGGAPTWSGGVGYPCCHLGHRFALILTLENPKYSKIILHSFLSHLDSI